MPDGNTDLAEPGTELILPNGVTIAPDGSRKDPIAENATEILNARESVKLVQKIQRSVGDLPDIPENMNPVCCIMAYTAVGLNDIEISKALNTTVENIERIKALDIYSEFERMFDERIFDDEVRNARHIIAKAQSRAAIKMTSLIDSNSGDLALMAAAKTMSIGGLDKSTQNQGMTKLQIVMVDSDELKRNKIEIKVG